MAQANCITTAIWQLLSRGRPPKCTSPVRLAHTELIATLTANIPDPIYAETDSGDLNGRSDNPEKVFGALQICPPIIGDTPQNISGGTLDLRFPDNLFQDRAADAAEVVRNAAEETGEDRNRRAS